MQLGRNEDLEKMILDECLLTDGPYTISSGEKVDSFLDIFRSLLSIRGRMLMAHDVFSAMSSQKWDNVDFVAGRETCGALLAFSLDWNKTLIVRKTSDKVESSTDDRGTCLLVDDVTSAGVSMKDSVLKLQKANYDVVGALSLVYRGRGAVEVAKELVIPFHWLVYYPE